VPAGIGARAQLGQEAALADAGGTADLDEPRAPPLDVRQGTVERRQLGGASDELRGGGLRDRRRIRDPEEPPQRAPEETSQGAISGSRPDVAAGAIADAAGMTISTPARLAAFAAGLALLGGAAAAVGAASQATPPLQDCLRIAAADAGLDDAMAGGGASHGGEPMIEAVPGSDGRRSELAGLRLSSLNATFTAGGSATWRFRIVGCDGEPVRTFEPEQGKLLHLIVVGTDFTGYQHLHPRLGRDGTWSITVRTPKAGRYRAIADFVIDGRKYVLGTTLTAAPSGAGTRTRPAPLPAPSLTARTGGYEVELQRPAVLEAGSEAQLTFRVTRGGRPVTDLEPYLGAYGHLVALHAPDLAYSHVHPDGEDRSAGAMTFDTELDEPGAYRLFMQFKVGGRVRTVAFTQHVS
jgi:hypothetical protein